MTTTHNETREAAERVLAANPAAASWARETMRRIENVVGEAEMRAPKPRPGYEVQHSIAHIREALYFLVAAGGVPPP